MAKNIDVNKPVFEYFKMRDECIYGRFADMVDKMWVQNKIQDSMVRRLVDLYAIAAAVGLRINRRIENDMTTTSGEGEVHKRNVQIQQLTDNYTTLSTLMRLVLMLDESRGLNTEERIRSAFRIPETKEEYDANMELFNSYVRGGIEFMYEQLVIRNTSADDEYYDARLNNIVAFLKDPMISVAESL